MASTLRCFPTPAALRVPGILGRGFRSVGAPIFGRNCDGFRFLRCSARDNAVESSGREEKKDVAMHAEPSLSPSSHSNAEDDSLIDQFGGWYGVEEVEKNTWKIEPEVLSYLVDNMGPDVKEILLGEKRNDLIQAALDSKVKFVPQPKRALSLGLGRILTKAYLEDKLETLRVDLRHKEAQNAQIVHVQAVKSLRDLAIQELGR